jgi:hypothetical protein
MCGENCVYLYILLTLFWPNAAAGPRGLSIEHTPGAVVNFHLNTYSQRNRALTVRATSKIVKQCEISNCGMEEIVLSPQTFELLWARLQMWCTRSILCFARLREYTSTCCFRFAQHFYGQSLRFWVDSILAD